MIKELSPNRYPTIDDFSIFLQKSDFSRPSLLRCRFSETQKSVCMSVLGGGGYLINNLHLSSGGPEKLSGKGFSLRIFESTIKKKGGKLAQDTEEALPPPCRGQAGAAAIGPPPWRSLFSWRKQFPAVAKRKQYHAGANVCRFSVIEAVGRRFIRFFE